MGKFEQIGPAAFALAVGSYKNDNDNNIQYTHIDIILDQFFGF